MRIIVHPLSADCLLASQHTANTANLHSIPFGLLGYQLFQSLLHGNEIRAALKANSFAHQL
jgi:hypothetical protein